MSDAEIGAGDLPRDRHAVVREHFPIFPLIIGLGSKISAPTWKRIGEALDYIIVVRCIGDLGVQLNADYGFLGNGRLAKDFLGPALQLDASHRLGHALGANRVRTAWEGETLLRLRHAAARHGCREQGQDDEAASPDWLLNLLHVQLSRRLAVSAAMAPHPERAPGRKSQAAARSLHCVWGAGRRLY